MTKLSHAHPFQGIRLLPVVLFALQRSDDFAAASSRLALLYALPEMATHSYLISPVLKLIFF